jgi:hypothetical protein
MRYEHEGHREDACFIGFRHKSSKVTFLRVKTTLGHVSRAEK